MTVETPGAVSLISQWFIRPGCEARVLKAVTKLAAEVAANEPGTLTYLVHTPRPDEGDLITTPPGDSRSLLFFETYRDADAFDAHVGGPLFKEFVKKHGHLFVQNKDGQPNTTVQFLTRRAGFAHGQPPPS